MTIPKNNTRTRFAPSPTGYLHIGGLRTALYAYLVAKQNGGVYILRIEDTDQDRFVPGAVEKMITALDNFGLHSDEGVMLDGDKVTSRGDFGPYIQSERIKIYQAIAEQLIAENKAYYCFCTETRLEELRETQRANKQVPKYDGFCRNLDPLEASKRLKTGEKAVIRYKITPNEQVVCNDKIYGQITVKTDDLDDFIILKSDGFPTYHLANVIDDHDMQTTHVIRGEEWLPSLPKHILLYQGLGYTAPEFVHLPLLLNPDRSKLSKRQGDVAAEDFLQHGYLPQALINYVALLGWNPGTEQEIFSIEELIKAFSLDKINKSGAIFDRQKLDWFNAEYIRQIVSSKNDQYQALINLSKKYLPQHEDRAEDVLKLFSSRINKLEELTELSKFLWVLPEYDTTKLVFKKSTPENTKKGLQLAQEKLATIKEDWELENLNKILLDIVSANNLTPGDVFWPIRFALSGLDKSPSPVEILEFLGQEESLKRLSLAQSKLV
ncbi:MAG: nondiscriminating glutamyl-tRNA synthetase [Patescibacteria group bacterium]|nr:nondiscriminating glutamyl-tRNA synthetase [Patescibacteria group bacterium]MDQ5970607.1 nondiscriminating glutamyl-tRNA synthetase [Patescibacteria group bacterium]